MLDAMLMIFDVVLLKALWLWNFERHYEEDRINVTKADKWLPSYKLSKSYLTLP